ncbi:zeta toxin family protein [Streptomyces abikoensis]|uniref:zeta toxin family protein n=1 Tax=Streptomyces abikoensis TaxID=97398 RepID=UPI00340518E8
MIDPAEVERHRLPEAENRRIFTERIVPDLLANRTPQDTPTTVFLIGQPGAGKSKVTEMVANTLNRHGGFVDVDSDLYKPYHPAYAALMTQDDTLMAAYTRADGRAWMAQAEQYVRDHGLHAIIQETSQNAEAVEAKMTAYRQAGTRVEALFMGVPQAMSNQGIVNRYFEQVADRGQGRLTIQANADESYQGILQLADRVDRGMLADLVSVYRRGENTPRYSNALDESGQWTRPPAARQAMETERSRSWTDTESSSFTVTQLRLREVSRGLGPDWPPRLARIEQEAQALMTAVDVQIITAVTGASAVSEVRAIYETAREMLGSVMADPPGSKVPPTLLPDDELAKLHAQLTDAEEAAERAARPPKNEAAEGILQQLADQNAPRETLERAQNSAREDAQYAREQAAAAGAQAARLGLLRLRTEGEIERRRQLSPAQRKVEEGVRQQLRGAMGKRRIQVSAPPSPSKIQPLRGQEQQRIGRGRSL